MKPKNLYLILCLAGAVIPYAVFIPWLLAEGLNIKLFVQQLFANRISVFFALDVIVSAVVVLAFAHVEQRRWRLRWAWIVVPAVLLVGVSFALPLCLWLREGSREMLSQAKTASAA